MERDDNPAVSQRISLFRQRTFAGLLAGSMSSTFGSAGAILAINWLVYAATGSAFDIALVGVAGLLPRIAFGVFAGALADRYDKLRLMIAADTLRAVVMILFALSLALEGFQLTIVLAATFVVGLGQSLFRPAFNSFVPTALPQEQIGTANGLFSAVQQVTSVVGGPLGGILIATIGVAATVAVNGASYLMSGILIVVVSLSISTGRRSQARRSEHPPFLKQVRSGFSYLNSERGLMKLTLASFGANFFLRLFFTFIVVYVTVVLAQGPLVYGILGAASGAGFGFGSLLVGRLHPERRFGYWYAVFWGMAGLGILGPVFFPETVPAGVFIFVLTACGGFANTAFVTGVQKYVPKEFLGRYFSLDDVGSLAATPAGQVAGGLLIAAYGISTDFVIAAIGTAAFSFSLLLFSDVRSLRA